MVYSNVLITYNCIGGKIMKLKPGRHTPAFILLFLAQKPSYGFELLKELESRLPFNPMDSAAIYRALKVLEADGSVEAEWDTSESGAAKKIYSITKIGVIKLSEFKKDIELRRKNLDFFISEYEELKI